MFNNLPVRSVCERYRKHEKTISSSVKEKLSLGEKIVPFLKKKIIIWQIHGTNTAPPPGEAVVLNLYCGVVCLRVSCGLHHGVKCKVRPGYLREGN
jgi:hypothetical protein